MPKATRKKVKKVNQEEVLNLSKKSLSPQIKLSQKQIAIGVVVIGIFAALYYLKGFFVAAIVNGQPISRLSIIQELESQSGKQALESLITKSLIKQEAQKQNVKISKEDIDAELEKLETSLQEQGQTLDTVLELQGMSQNELKEQIEIQKIIENLLSDKATASAEEVDEYIQSNSDFLPKDGTPEEIQQAAQEQLKQQKLSQEFQAWLQTLQENAKIRYFVKY